MTRTLIVDDEEDIRILLRVTIDRANRGLKVECEADDGESAVATWRERRPDIVVLDHRMPGLTGLDAAERILAEDPEQRIVLFSAFLDDELRERATSLGVKACVSKDDFEEIPRALWALSAA